MMGGPDTALDTMHASSASSLTAACTGLSPSSILPACSVRFGTGYFSLSSAVTVSRPTTR